MKRTPLLRRTPLKAKQRRRDATEKVASEAWKRAVCDEKPCAVSGSWGNPSNPIVGHHAITQQCLRRRAAEIGIPAAVLLWDPRVGMPLVTDIHIRHHSRLHPIAFEDLPDSVHEFAADYGLTYWLERVYPRHCPDCGEWIINRGAHFERCTG